MRTSFASALLKSLMYLAEPDQSQLLANPRPIPQATSRALRPGGEEMRESGLKRAIKSSFDMASDPRPQTESWFRDS